MRNPQLISDITIPSRLPQRGLRPRHDTSNPPISSRLVANHITSAQRSDERHTATSIDPSLATRATEASESDDSQNKHPPILTARSSAQSRLVRYVLHIITLLILGASGYLAVDTWLTNRDTESVTQQTTSREDTISEVPVTNAQKDAYVVAPDMPRMISIPSLNINARVLRLGIDEAGLIAAPKTADDTGWYEGSAKPGADGNVFIDGHVSGTTKPAVFASLNRLKQGDTITIELGDASTITYTVSTIENKFVDDIDMRRVLASPAGVSQGLVLMTCAGAWDAKERSYANRTIVYAERII